jgi:aspartyl aminopeptidase
MEYISTDVNFWIQNAVHERARLAIEELVAVDIRTKLTAGGTVSGTKEDIVMASDLPNAQARSEENARVMMAEIETLSTQEKVQ